MRLLGFIIRTTIKLLLLAYLLGLITVLYARNDPSDATWLILATLTFLGLRRFFRALDQVPAQPAAVTAVDQLEMDTPLPAPTATMTTGLETGPGLDQIPGIQGARLALNVPQDTQPETIAVRYQNETKAYVGLHGWYPVGEFADLQPEDPEYRLVAMMSVWAQHVLLDDTLEYSDQDAVAYALGELVPHELLERDLPQPSETARALNLPETALSPDNLRALRALLTAQDGS